MDTTPLNTSQMNPTPGTPSSSPPGGGFVQHYYNATDQNQPQEVVPRQWQPPVPSHAHHRTSSDSRAHRERENIMHPRSGSTVNTSHPGSSRGTDPRYLVVNGHQSSQNLLSSPGHLQQELRRHYETPPPSSGLQPTPTHHFPPTEYVQRGGFGYDPFVSNSTYQYPLGFVLQTPTSGNLNPGHTSVDSEDPDEFEGVAAYYADVSYCL